MKKSIREIFEEKVLLIPFSTCHWWDAAQTEQGYGQAWNGTKRVRAHRLAYELYVGPIPEGLHVLHHCDNPSCVNPAHLFPGTDQDNATDMLNKGRGGRKLTETDVLSIRSMKGSATHVKIAEMFGVGPAIIGFIMLRKRWKHI